MITCEKNKIDGAWQLSAVQLGEYIHMKYMGYTKKEALQLFREHLKETKAKIFVNIPIKKKG